MNKLIFITLIAVLIFSLSPGIAEAHCKWYHPHHCVAKVVVDVVKAAADFVVNVVTVVANVVVGVAEVVLGNVIDFVGSVVGSDALKDFGQDLKDSAKCRFSDVSILSSDTALIPGTAGEVCEEKSVAPVLPPPTEDGGAIETVETWVVSGVSQPLCDSVTLSGIDAKGHNYAIVRDGQIVAQLSADKTSYTDTGLTPHTNYEYKIRIPYPEEAGFQTSDSVPIAAYTKCLPQCGFGMKEKSVAKFGKVTLVWNCNYNDPSADKGSCRIEDSAAGKDYSVSAKSGTLEVAVTAATTFVLNCANVDGAISVPQSIEVLEPGIKEVKP